MIICGGDPFNTTLRKILPFGCRGIQESFCLRCTMLTDSKQRAEWIHWFFRQDKHTGPCVTGDTARHRDPTHPTPVVYKRLPHHTSEPSWQSISSGTSIEPDFQTSPKELSDIWNGNCRQRDIDNVVSQRIGYVSDFTTPLFLLQNCFKKSFNMKFSSVFVRMWSQFIFYLFCIKEVETV